MLVSVCPLKFTCCLCLCCRLNTYRWLVNLFIFMVSLYQITLLKDEGYEVRRKVCLFVFMSGFPYLKLTATELRAQGRTEEYDHSTYTYGGFATLMQVLLLLVAMAWGWIPLHVDSTKTICRVLCKGSTSARSAGSDRSRETCQRQSWRACACVYALMFVCVCAGLLVFFTALILYCSMFTLVSGSSWARGSAPPAANLKGSIVGERSKKESFGSSRKGRTSVHSSTSASHTSAPIFEGEADVHNDSTRSAASSAAKAPPPLLELADMNNTERFGPKE